MGMIFLISSSGYVMYKSNCLCIGDEQTTVFVRPDTCGEEFHKHHKHDEANNEITCCASECHDCSEHTKDCGCDSPEIFFFKLKDKAVDDEVKFTTVQPVVLAIHSSDIFEELIVEKATEPKLEIYNDPPPKISSSLDFLIQIQQLKIPFLA